MRARRATPRRREAPREDWDWWQTATLALLTRDHHRCARCGQPVTNQAERHHRQRRRDGGDRLSNLLILHSLCHMWITEHPEQARDRGWIVSAYARDPATVPVWIGGSWWTLDDDGGRTRLDALAPPP